MSRTFGTEADTPYLIYIKEEDREKAIAIIKEGLKEYIGDVYFEAYKKDTFYKTGELCNTKKMITFVTIIVVQVRVKNHSA
jgi:hypothetical protein